MWSIVYFYIVSTFIKFKYKVSINKHLFIIIFFIELYSLYSKDILFFLLFSILLFQSITDYINNDVYTFCNIIIASIGLLFIKPSITSIITSLVLPIVLIVLNSFIKGIGDGDIELLICLCFIYDLYSLSLIVLLASTLNFIYALILKKDKYSFIPFIFVCSLIIYII